MLVTKTGKDEVRVVIEQVRAVYKTGTATGTGADSLTSNY